MEKTWLPTVTELGIGQSSCVLMLGSNAPAVSKGRRQAVKSTRQPAIITCILYCMVRSSELRGQSTHAQSSPPPMPHPRVSSKKHTVRKEKDRKMGRLIGAIRWGAQRSSYFSYLRRSYHCSTTVSSDDSSRYNQPISGYDMPRSGGIATVFRLPLIQDDDHDGLDACFIGIPMDHGTSNRSGTRLGPRAIRNESVLIRPVHTNGACPFDSLIATSGSYTHKLHSFERMAA